MIRRSASITGSVLAGPESRVPDGLLRVTASREGPWADIQFPNTLTQRGRTFALDVPPGHYVFSVRGDRPPMVAVKQITIDGVDAALSGVDISPGQHEVALAIGPALVTLPVPTSAVPLSSLQLVEQFLERPTLELATQLAARGEVGVLPRLAALLKHDDRHIRGNAAVVFAGLGDELGFATISAILDDRSYRPPGQGQPGGSSDGKYHVEAQIRADRYYAAHLLGDIRDPRGVPLLVELVDDRDVNAVVPWSLEQIGGPEAVAALIEMLGHRDPSTRVGAIHALATLGAREALPRLEALTGDTSRSNSGNQVTVGAAAAAAVATLRGN
jgi:HEAT repeat protein